MKFQDWVFDLAHERCGLQPRIPQLMFHRTGEWKVYCQCEQCVEYFIIRIKDRDARQTALAMDEKHYTLQDWFDEYQPQCKPS